VKRIEVVANIASGSVGPGAPEIAERLLAEYGVSGVVHAPQPGELVDCLRTVIDSAPDAVLVLAGDGTARAAAEMAGPDGPLIAPLPGGTMNMLPRALYGDRDWQAAMRACLETGEARTISGGEVGGRLFFVAAILGSPALWATAREAARAGRMDIAIARSRRALKRAFSGRLRFSLDGRPEIKAEALTLMCPLVSTALDAEERALEAAALDPSSALDVFRLGFNAARGQWREDPSVNAGRCRTGKVRAHGRIPAILDGEPARLDPEVSIRFRPKAFRALVSPPETSTETPQETLK
jgi:diacylglycerol kinase family enzyme